MSSAHRIFVTVNKLPNLPWEALEAEVLEILTDYLAGKSRRADEVKRAEDQ